MEPSSLLLDGARNLFVCHRWHYDAPWVNFVAMIDAVLGEEWRNWSLPWHDPSLERSEPAGESKLRKMLQGQIANSEIVFLLQDIADIGGPRSAWLPRQIEIAQEMKKTIVGVEGMTGKPLSPEWSNACIASIQFIPSDVRNILERGL